MAKISNRYLSNAVPRSFILGCGYDLTGRLENIRGDFAGHKFPENFFSHSLLNN
jgi:hypothetical protein